MHRILLAVVIVLGGLAYVQHVVLVQLTASNQALIIGTLDQERQISDLRDWCGK